MCVSDLFMVEHFSLDVEFGIYVTNGAHSQQGELVTRLRRRERAGDRDPSGREFQTIYTK